MPEPLIDFAIITAIEIERRAVCQAFDMTDEDRVRLKTRTYWRKGLHLKDRYFYEIVVAQSPDMAGVNAALLVADTIHDWNPDAMLLVGIAGAASEKQHLGDLIIASDVYYYERGKLTSDGNKPEPYMFKADPTLWDRVNTVADWTAPISVARPDGIQDRPKIHYGVIASGEKVIAFDVVRDDIAAGQRKIKAIEMEGYGFSAAIWQSFDRVRHLVIKAICDRADSSKNDEWHEYAAAVAAEFTKHFLLDKPLPPQKSPPSPSRYRLIVNKLKSANLVPFLGPGINPKFYIDLALNMATSVWEDFPSTNGEDQSQNRQLVQALIGIPCSDCPYWPKDRPKECPMLKNIDGSSKNVKDCPLYIEQQLAVSKMNLRYISQYYILRNDLDGLYINLYEILEKLGRSHKPSSLHHFLAELPNLMRAKGKPQRSPGLPFQLIVTTNYDDMLEQAFLEARQPFDVVFYIADGPEKGKFKHKPYEGKLQTIGVDESNRLPLRTPWGNSPQPRPVILKLFGTWKDPWENNFVATEQQISYLISTLKQNLPTSLWSILTKGNILFMGYSPSDPDLQLLMHCLWQANKITAKSLLLHRAKPGGLEQELWKSRNVELLDMPSSVDDFVAQLQEVIEAQIQ